VNGPLGRQPVNSTWARAYRRGVNSDENAPWAPDACTLPTAERPLRAAEFDELFATSVRRVVRSTSTSLHLGLEATAEVAARAADLTVRETGCCSFFTFVLTATGGELSLGIEVPEHQFAVLDAIEARAVARAEARR